MGSKHKANEQMIVELKEERLSLEDDKRSLDLKVAQLKDEIKKLKKHKSSGLGLDKTALMQTEANFLNVNDMNLSVSKKVSPKESTHNSATVSSVMSDNDNDDASNIQPGSHDFNFSEMDSAPPKSNGIVMPMEDD